MAARNRPLVVGGLALAGAAGYYLYRAGGDPKVAERKAERESIAMNPLVQSSTLMMRIDDAARMSSRVRGSLPGTEKEITTKAKELGAEAGAKIDDVVGSPSATRLIECVGDIY